MILLQKKDGENILWEKDDRHWNRVAPHLFPIVGRLKNDAFEWKDESYAMRQHGFARDQEFNIVKQTNDSVTFQLTASSETLQQYPFDFCLQIAYQLTASGIQVRYSVKNTGHGILPFSIGGHPGFALNDSLEHYSLRFPEPFTADRRNISEAYYTEETETMNIHSSLDLSDELFESDAIVFRNPPFNKVTLVHDQNGPIASLSSSQWDAIGFWTKKSAPFFCLEPWWGWADKHSASGKLTEKEGLHWLNAGEEKYMDYTIDIYGV